MNRFCNTLTSDYGSDLLDSTEEGICVHLKSWVKRRFSVNITAYIKNHFCDLT